MCICFHSFSIETKPTEQRARLAEAVHYELGIYKARVYKGGKWWNMMALGEEDWDIVAHKGPKMGVIGSSPYGQGQAPQAIRVMYLIILTRGREATLVWLQLSNSWFHS